MSKHEKRVTLRGKGVVVVLAGKFDRLRFPRTGEALIRAIADPRARELDFEHPKRAPPVT